SVNAGVAACCPPVSAPVRRIRRQASLGSGSTGCGPTNHNRPGTISSLTAGDPPLMVIPSGRPDRPATEGANPPAHRARRSPQAGCRDLRRGRAPTGGTPGGGGRVAEPKKRRSGATFFPNPLPRRQLLSRTSRFLGQGLANGRDSGTIVLFMSGSARCPPPA